MAALIEFYKGKRGDETIPLQDDQEVLNFLKTSWTTYSGNPADLFKFVFDILALKSVWKNDLNQVPGLTKAVTRHLLNIETLGMKAALISVTRQSGDVEEKSIQVD